MYNFTLVNLIHKYSYMAEATKILRDAQQSLDEFKVLIPIDTPNIRELEDKLLDIRSNISSCVLLQEMSLTDMKDVIESIKRGYQRKYPVYDRVGTISGIIFRMGSKHLGAGIIMADEIPLMTLQRAKSDLAGMLEYKDIIMAYNVGINAEGNVIWIFFTEEAFWVFEERFTEEDHDTIKCKYKYIDLCEFDIVRNDDGEHQELMVKYDESASMRMDYMGHISNSEEKFWESGIHYNDNKILEDILIKLGDDADSFSKLLMELWEYVKSNPPKEENVTLISDEHVELYKSIPWSEEDDERYHHVYETICIPDGYLERFEEARRLADTIDRLYP